MVEKEEEDPFSTSDIGDDSSGNSGKNGYEAKDSIDYESAVGFKRIFSNNSVFINCINFEYRIYSS